MTEPTMTADELDRAIIDASREYIAIVRAYPRDEPRIAAAKAAIEDLKALRDAMDDGA